MNYIRIFLIGIYGRTANGSSAGLLYVGSYYGLGHSYATVGTQLRLKERDDADYLKKNFTDLLFDWFRK
jgi:hypothetical protein